MSGENVGGGYNLQTWQATVRRLANEARARRLREHWARGICECDHNTHFGLFALYDAAKVADHLHADILSTLHRRDDATYPVWTVVKIDIGRARAEGESEIEMAAESVTLEEAAAAFGASVATVELVARRLGLRLRGATTQNTCRLALPTWG